MKCDHHIVNENLQYRCIRCQMSVGVVFEFNDILRAEYGCGGQVLIRKLFNDMYDIDKIISRQLKRTANRINHWNPYGF